MQTKISSLSTLVKRLTFLVVTSILLTLAIAAPVMAQASECEPIPQTVYDQVKDSDCPEALKRSVEEAYTKGYCVSIDGSYGFTVNAVNNGAGVVTKEYTSIGCASPSAFPKLVVRATMFVILIVGLVFAFSVGKSSVMLILASSDAEKVQAAIKSIQTSIAAIVGVFIAYILIVFLLTSVFNFGDSSKNYSIVCRNQIIFSLTFDTTPPECQ